MRNSDFRDDIKVYTFVNSAHCSYNEFRQFLILNALPLRERWAFYFFGKSRSLDNIAIGDMEIQGPRYYGGFVYGEIYYWQKYLRDELETRQSIESDLRERGEPVTPEIVNHAWIERGWAFVADGINDGEYCDDNIEADFNFRSSSRNAYCEACQESPCMCSDREKSSMTNEY